MGKTYIFPFFSRSLSSLCVIYPYSNNLSVHSCYKNYKNLCSPLIHSLWHNKNFKIFLSHTKLLSLCVVGPQVMGKTYKNFSLSLSVFLFKICCVIYHHRGRSSVHSSKRVTTGPNSLQRVPTG